MLALLKHPNIIRILDLREHESRLCLVLEYAENGTLSDALHPPNDIQRVEYSFGRKLSWLQQTAAALAYLHSIVPFPVIHRDVKPKNILLCDNYKIAKLTNFGLATIQQPEMTNQTGTLLWMAPEVFSGMTYSTSCDVYSFGIVMWEVLSGRVPYNTESGVTDPTPNEIVWYFKNVVEKGLRPEKLPLPVSDELNALMNEAWMQIQGNVRQQVHCAFASG
ncbi:unnamed protein product [Sphagnum balticum]